MPKDINESEEFVPTSLSDKRVKVAFWNGVWTGVGSIMFLSLIFGGRKVVEKHHHHHHHGRKR
jgi:hypothetical protein